MRNPELSKSTQIILSAVFSAIVTIVLVLAAAVYQSVSGAWVISNAALATFALIVSLTVTLKEIVQMIMASDKPQQAQPGLEVEAPQWTQTTTPQPVVPMQARRFKDYAAQ